MFERMEITESIYEGVITPSYKKLLSKKPTIMDSLGIKEDNTPCQTLTPRGMRALAININYMWIAQRAH